MAKRIYFYKDGQGIIQKYSYCSICGAGPFKQSERDLSFISTGSKCDICYCDKCHKNLGIKNVGVPLDDIPFYKNHSKVIDAKKPIVPEKKVLEVPIEHIADPELLEEIPQDISEEIPIIPEELSDIPEESTIADDLGISEEITIAEEIPVFPGAVSASSEEITIAEELLVIHEDVQTISEEIPIIHEDVQTISEEITVTEEIPVIHEDVQIISEEHIVTNVPEIPEDITPIVELVNSTESVENTESSTELCTQEVPEDTKEAEVSNVAPIDQEINEPLTLTTDGGVLIFSKDSNVIVDSVVVPEPDKSTIDISTLSDTVIIEEPEINGVNPTLIEEPEINRDVFKEEAKKSVNFEPDIYVYMGQYTDGSFRVDITRNIQVEIKKINQGKYPDVINLPLELIYYKKFKDWKKALIEKDKIQQMTTNEKEELSRAFIKLLFKNLNI